MNHLDNLNPPQLEAVKHTAGPIMVFAGAGSGKTRVLTRRIASLVIDHGVRPDSILAVTFTNKACQEMKTRVRQLLGDGGSKAWIGTFHSISLRILRRHGDKLKYRPNFVVYDEDDKNKTIKAVLAELKIDDKKFPPKFYGRIIDKAKNSGLTAEAYQTNNKQPDKARVAEVFEHYQRALLRANAMDFGDLLVNAVQLFKEFPEVGQLYSRYLQFILVDEFQDTNSVQYEFLKYLTTMHQNIFVVGDDDQSIYGFRGANAANIDLFKKDFKDTKVVKLEQNYRSTMNILETANSVIKVNAGRTPKKLWTNGEEGGPVVTYVAWDEQDEARFIATEIKTKLKEGIEHDKIAILYRTNAQSRALEEALLDEGIPYRIYGGLKFYDRREIKDVIAYLKLLVNEDDNQSFLRVVNMPTRGVGARAVESLYQRAILERTSLFKAARNEASEGKVSKGIVVFIELIDLLKEKIEKSTLSELIDAVIEESGYGPKLQALKTEEAESRLENLMELKGIGASMEVGDLGNEADEDIETVNIETVNIETVNIETVNIATINIATKDSLEKISSGKITLSNFLDRVSLSSSQELPVEENKDIKAMENAENATETAMEPPKFVSLLTLHLAKGLEFPVVFLTGIEEGLLPHSRSIDDGTVDEERRLCYVGITRAMTHLYLTRTKSRGMFSSGGSFGQGSGGFRAVSRFAKEMPVERLEDRGEKFNSFSAWSDRSIEIDDEYLESQQGFEKRLQKAKKKAEDKGKSLRFRPGWLTSADNLE